MPGIKNPELRLVLGGNTFGWTSDRETSFAVLDDFLAAGGTHIDTADMYAAWIDEKGGHSETVLGEWFQARGNRERVVLATKVGGLKPYDNQRRESVQAALEDALRRLQTDYVDILYSHYDDENVSIAEQAKTYDELVRSGKVRAIGLSNYSPERMREFFAYATEHGLTVPAVIQTQYNLVHRRDFEQTFQLLAEEYGAATFPYFALASGFLTGKYRTPEDLEGRDRAGFVEGYATPPGFGVVDKLVEIAEQRGVEPASVPLAWQLAKGASAPIASASKPEQLPALTAAAGLSLTDVEVATLDDASSVYA
ncbi:alcohol dehydrogenase [Corynebacterium yudongzhengii]|uniref:Aldo/keto reductase n=1 Tax=Corynebacterium yudongzhengii TaxID=2080740 RepID=A0A2U1T737_9CORY|nr:aldo/keto reductase [Corynebacterium yudongzhengii]AWB81377.1 alcohol dehydrogenase [Corynebacterium yudongzhengii]PWC01820.1 aldo/keto reductase [Corynebacterium yudongzhengii]